MNVHRGKKARKAVYRWLSLGLLSLLLIPFGTTAYAASGTSVRALTGAPPSELVAPMSIFNPSHLYLDSGGSSITASTGKVTVAASTTALIAVDSIGITFYVQKWNGSSWETVGSGTTTGGNNASSYTNSLARTVTSGYYYRSRTIHWVIENGVYEEGELFSSSVLVS
ncbi:DUF6147 family protein [Cohnella faecalis]|uniref:Uncharacterized protein n=1 Tax=Cohnella faecalis TaxID=2315694 RepID=A0A398CXP5_9BACL|nr:DUF6147 family protein [Cohnella faecalis]RIE03754.1 hypothetical protein D3H35_09355 [Cohnella faecalis]